MASTRPAPSSPSEWAWRSSGSSETPSPAHPSEARASSPTTRRLPRPARPARYAGAAYAFRAASREPSSEMSCAWRSRLRGRANLKPRGRRVNGSGHNFTLKVVNGRPGKPRLDEVTGRCGPPEPHHPVDLGRLARGPPDQSSTFVDALDEDLGEPTDPRSPATGGDV